MIKQNSRDLKYYKYSKLYLDEINDLLDIIQENGFKYEITINNFELESREEIEKFSEKKVEKFEIYISEIRFHIKYEKNEIIIFSDDSLKSQGMKTSFEKYLINNENKLQKFLNSFSVVLTGFILIFFLGVYSFFQFSNRKSISYIITIMGLLGSFIIINNVINSAFYKKLIFLENKSNCRNFFVRQKDSIVLSLLSVIIGSLLTLLVELIIRKIN